MLLVFKVWWDHRAKNKKRRIINHARSAGIDLTIYCISSYLLFNNDLLLLSAWVLTGLSYRWIVFDAVFSKLNWDTWSFYGTSSWIDRQLIKAGKYHLLIKLIPLIIGVTLILTQTHT